MKTSLTNPVVVGVDGSDPSLRAVRFAALEAQRLGCGLRVVHAVPEVVPMAPVIPLSSIESFDLIGHRILREAQRYAHDLTGGSIEMETVIRFGSRVRALVDAGEDACFIVLGHRDRSIAGRIFSASTSTGVAARAHCPVVSVPATWKQGEPHGLVVVGVDEIDHAHEALVKAFEAASARGARLTILHAWKLQNPYDEIVSQMSKDEWRDEVKTAVEKAVTELRDAYPEVDMTVDVRHENPADALLSAAEGADLLVLGRRGHGAPLGFYLGSIARTLIREASCPVEITPLHHRDEDDPAPEDEWLADELSPQT